MEYCEGGDLRTALNEHHNTSGLVESEVRSVLKCLLSAISYLHGIKISHRDIKPENCVIKKNQHGEKIYKVCQCQLLDFTLTKMRILLIQVD